MKTEYGVMVVKDGKAWALVYDDGHSSSYGWVDLEDGKIYNPRWVKKASDVTYPGSHDKYALAGGKVVKVRRTTTVELSEWQSS